MNLQPFVDPHRWQPFLEPTTWSTLGRGLVVTLQVTLAAAVLSMLLGALLALLRLSRAWPVHYPALLFIETIRALPVLFIIFFIWAIFLRTHVAVPLWITAAAGLTIYTSAVVAEIVRAGITSIEFGQVEAARALGLSYVGTMRFVVLPQALRRMVPPLVSQLITLLKDSSLASIIALKELISQGANLYNFYGNPLQMLIVVALIYFVINFTLSRLSRRLEAARRQREPRVHIAPRETEAAA
jgi:putative glutamine transport system permease protein